MDEKSTDMHHGETTHPEQNQNQRENEKHCEPLSLWEDLREAIAAAHHESG
jgi:hypothetical protein